MSCILLGDYASLSRLKIPLFLERVSAGFPSPAEDYVEKTIDLNGNPPIFSARQK